MAEWPGDVRESIERCWLEEEAIDSALERGDIGEAEWFRRSQALIVPAYLAAETPYAQAGHSGDARRWELARRHVLAAVDRGGTFPDVGCGFAIAGRVEREHDEDPRIVRRVFWVDAPGR
jgi:hypothetical protein